MRFLHFILFAFICLFFSSCNDDDEPMSENLSGTWNLIELQIDDQITTTTTVVAGQTFESTVTGSTFGKNLAVTTTISESPNTMTSSGTYTAVVTFIVNGAESDQEIPLTPFSLSGSWAINGNIITTIENDGDIATLTITEITDDSLKLESIFDDTEEVDANTTIRGQGHLFYSYTR